MLLLYQFNEIPDNMKCYEEYINNIINELEKELINTFDIKNDDKNDSLKRIFEKSKEKFIFIFDEWD